MKLVVWSDRSLLSDKELGRASGLLLVELGVETMVSQLKAVGQRAYQKIKHFDYNNESII